MNLMQLGWRALMDDKPYVKGLIGDLSNMSRLHIELFIAEARIERERLKRKALLLCVSFIALAIAVVFLLVAIIAAFWDTPYRFFALFCLPLLLLIIAGICYRAATLEMAEAPPFALSAAEIKKDANWLISLL